MSNRKVVYGVFFGTKWGVTANLNAVREAVEKNPSAEVRTMDAEAYRDGNRGIHGGWDCPTFYALSEPCTDFAPLATAA